MVFPPNPLNIEKAIKYKSELLVDKSLGIQEVFVGSSRVFRHVDPEVYQNCSGKSIFNFGIAATSNPESYYITEHLCDHGYFDGMKTCFIELTPYALTNFSNLSKSKSYYWINRSYFSYAFNYVHTAQWKFSKKMYYYSTLATGFILKSLDPFERNNSNEDSYSKEIFKKNNGYVSLEEDLKFGRIPNLDKRRRKLLKSPNGLTGKARLSENRKLITQNQSLQREILTRIKNKLNAKNIKVVGVILPRSLNYEEVDQVKEFDLFPVIDLSNSQQYKEFYNIEYSFDKGHLSDRGAQLFSEKFCELLKDKN